MVTVPAAAPITRPLPGVMVAMDGLLLLHNPPEVTSDIVVDVPTHMPDTPVITAGLEFTVTCCEVAQLPGIVYTIVELPAEMPVSKPDAEPIVATPVEPLVHVPPLKPSVSVVLPPIQIANDPLIGVGLWFTVTGTVA
jgi:hypothetical protein